MNSGDSFSRGRYGSLPESRLSSRQKSAFKARVNLAAVMARWCRLFYRPLRSVTAEPELQFIEEASNRADFRIVRPLRVPRGYRIADLAEIPGSPEITTFVFRSESGEQFSMEQRKSWLPLEEEIESARVPFAKVEVEGNDCYLVSGYYGGEPIDHAYWFSRLSIAFEVADVVVELRDISTRRAGRKLWIFLCFAAYLMRQKEAGAEPSAPV